MDATTVAVDLAKDVFEVALANRAGRILDRLLHHAITVNIRGNSYRLKDKLKAGLVTPADAPA